MNTITEAPKVTAQIKYTETGAEIHLFRRGKPVGTMVKCQRFHAKKMCLELDIPFIEIKGKENA